MKQLQNNFTTLEQSKRLLELGVPADSADCFRRTSGTIEVRSKEDYTYDFFLVNIHFTPCWSAGRLIEIFLLCTSYREISLHCENLVEQMVVSIFMVHKDNLIDFSKLEN